MRLGATWRYVVVFAVLALVTVAGGGSPAEATFPGGNGSIVYTVRDEGTPGTDLWMADEGGGNERKVYDSIGVFATWGPAFSPAGGTVAYNLANTFAFHTMYVNIFDTAGAATKPCGGSDPDPLCNGKTLASFPTMQFYEEGPTWSPDGSQLAVAAGDGIWVINVIEARECENDPCQVAARTLILPNTDTITYSQPNWQPGGSLIAVRIYEEGVGAYGFRYDLGMVESTGGEVTHLNVWRDDPTTSIDNGCWAGHPNWSPDGVEIAFETGECFRPVKQTMLWPPHGPISFTVIPSSNVAVVTPGGPWRRLTGIFESNAYSFIGQTDPVWAPDKSRIIFHGNCSRGGSPVTGICAVSLDGESHEYWGELGRFPDWSTGDGVLPDATFDARRASGTGLSGLHRGDMIQFNGEGWQQGGPPIVIKWAGEEVATISSDDAAFAGTFAAPDFPEFDSRQSSLGQTPCEANITATQGGIHRTLHASGEPGEVVYVADGVTRFDGGAISFGQSISCKGGVFLAEDDIPLTLGPISSNICLDPDIESQMKLVTSSISGRAKDGALDQVEAYPGMWVQFIGPNGASCIDANGIHADQLWIGSQLVATGTALGETPEFLTTIDLSSGDYTRRQPSGGVSVNAHIVQFLLPVPPPGDMNQNGVQDELEIDPDAFKRQFSDLRISGSTHGKIVIEDNVAFTVFRDENTGSLDIAAAGTPFDVRTGEENAAELEICDTPVRMKPGDHAQFKCDSLSSSVIAGEVQVVMGVNTGAILPAGSNTTITEQAGDEFSVANNDGSAADVLLFAEGALTTVSPGDSEEATVLALKGDVDCGGRIEAMDSVALLRILAGLSAEADSCPASAIAQRDIDCLNGITVKDALVLLQFAGEISVTLGAGCAAIGTFPVAP